MKDRGRQLGEQIRRTVSELLVTAVHDPRIAHVTVTGVKVTRDMGLARIYWSAEVPRQDRETIAQGLAAAAGFLRRALAEKIRLRIMPQLEFFYDESFNEMARIDTLFANLEKPK